MRSNLYGSFRALVISIVLLSVCLGFNPVFAQQMQEQSKDKPVINEIMDQPEQAIQGDQNLHTDQGMLMQASSADQAWWRNLSQNSRNQAIIDAASRDIGRNVGLNCKGWLQESVVPRASRFVASLPLTAPNENGYYWYGGQFVALVCMNASGCIRAVKPGYIVQTNWRTTRGIQPHTFLVVGTSSTGMYIAESNWFYINTVDLRWVNFSEFDQQVVAFSVYYVTGG